MIYFISRHRGSEIQDWLKWGLSDEDVEQAIHILNDTAT